jgi:hypothetical protein
MTTKVQQANGMTMKKIKVFFAKTMHVHHIAKCFA